MHTSSRRLLLGLSRFIILILRKNARDTQLLTVHPHRRTVVAPYKCTFLTLTTDRIFQPTSHSPSPFKIESSHNESFNECLGTTSYIARFGTRAPFEPPRTGDLIDQNPFSVGVSCSVTKIGFCRSTDNSPAYQTKIEDVINSISSGSDYTLVRSGLYHADSTGLYVRHGFRNGQNKFYKACSKPFEHVFGMETIRETRDSSGRKAFLWHMFVSCLDQGRTMHFAGGRINDSPKPTDTSFLGMAAGKLQISLKACDPAYRECGDLDIHNYQFAATSSQVTLSKFVFETAAVESRKCAPGGGTFHFHTQRHGSSPHYEQICKRSHHMISFIFNLRPS